MDLASVFDKLGLHSSEASQPSKDRFPDGAEFRIEIPSVETPRVLSAVLKAAEEYHVTVNRVSQGSGAMLLSRDELHEMAVMGAEAGLEISLFVGPRGAFDVGALARAADNGSSDSQLRGTRQLAWAIKDVLRAIEMGIRGFLVADLGLLSLVGRMQASGHIPQDVVWKVSAMLGASNPAAVQVLRDLGAGSVNVAADLTPELISEMRQMCSIPLDLYLEAPDSMGGMVRGHEIGDFVACAAPLHAKFGLRNAPNVYPAGIHNASMVEAMAIEKVRRASIALEWLEDERPESIQSKPHATGLGVPKP